MTNSINIDVKDLRYEPLVIHCTINGQLKTLTIAVDRTVYTGNPTVGKKTILKGDEWQ